MEQEQEMDAVTATGSDARGPQAQFTSWNIYMLAADV